ncbi:MAG: hypothetical protein ABJA02_09485 [Acidobacteriota bacterium]
MTVPKHGFRCTKSHVSLLQNPRTLGAAKPDLRPLSRILLIAAIALSGAFICAAQSPPPPTPAPPRPNPFSSFRRFVELDALSVSTRYRYIGDSNRAIAANQDQYQIIARGRFKFDKSGRYSIGFGLQTGNVFNAGWNSTGWGTGAPRNDLILRQLYFDARPVNGLEIQIGGLAFNNGENTEITSYDNDGYLTGERVRITRPKRLFFDEISLTRAYIGDTARPNIFARLHRLGNANYYQLLGRKRLNKSVSFSADYTYEAGSDTLRQGVKFSVPKFALLDSFLFENYERLDPKPGYGFSVYGQKKVNRHLTVGEGFARIDRTMLNADRFPRGNRIFANILVPVTRELSVNAVAIHGLGPIAATLPRTRIELIVSYNVLETLKRFKIQ